MTLLSVEQRVNSTQGIAQEEQRPLADPGVGEHPAKNIIHTRFARA